MIISVINANEKNLEIIDPKYIPRIGERVMWNYEPTPIVENVVHDIMGDRVFVFIR